MRLPYMCMLHACACSWWGWGSFDCDRREQERHVPNHTHHVHACMHARVIALYHIFSISVQSICNYKVGGHSWKNSDYHVYLQLHGTVYLVERWLLFS